MSRRNRDLVYGFLVLLAAIALTWLAVQALT